MSIFEEIDSELLKKKDEFIWTTYGNFSKEEISHFQNSRKKIWAIKWKIWNLNENKSNLEPKIKESDVELKKYAKWTLSLIFALAIANYFGVIDLIAFIFISLALGAMIIWQQISHKISTTAFEIKTHNYELAILQLESQLEEFELIHLPDMNQYMKAYEKRRYASNELSKDEKTIMSEFEVEMNLAILESMGYNAPTLWF